MTEDAWYQYVYDAWNRLVTVKTRHDGRTIGAYDYDATGRRIRKVVIDSGDRDGTEYFYYAGPQLIEVRDGSENALRQFVWGTQYIDEPIALIDNPGVSEKWYFYHQDANFNVVMLTDENGLEAEHYEYTPYGQLAVTDANFRPLSESAVANPFTYTGRYHDVETDLYYYRARHYHPALGRFVQRDPLAFLKGFDITWHYLDGLNLYEYVRSRSILRTDPSGLAIDIVPDIIQLGRDLKDLFPAWITLGREVVFGDVPSERITEARRINKRAAIGIMIGTPIALIPCVVNPRILSRGADAAEQVGKAAAGAGRLSKEAKKGIRSLEKRIAEHEKKLKDFRTNPTPRPGTEGLSKEIQQQSIDGRIRHLEKEIEIFKKNIEKLIGGWQ